MRVHLVTLCLFLSSALYGQSDDQKMKDLFLNLSQVTLGPVNSGEEKKAIDTVDLEQSQITRSMLKDVYHNAYDLYKKGDFVGAKRLTSQILAIDPDYQDAQILQNASIDFKGSPKPLFAEHKLAVDKFDEGMEFYREGRLVDAESRFKEVVQLSPYNLKAKFWLKKCRFKLAHEHFVRGRIFYQKREYKEALDQWYSALVLNPRYPHLQEAIQRVEMQQKNRDMNKKLEAALSLYGEGQTDEALKILDQILAYEPSNNKVRSLMGQIRSEVANQHVVAGRDLYRQGHFNQAIAQWKRATDYGYDTESADQLIAQAKDAIVNRRKALKAEEEAARKRKEEEIVAAKKKAEEKKKQKQTAQTSSVSSSTQTAQNTSAPPLQTAQVSEEDKKASKQHYLLGIEYYMNHNYEQAKNEWILAKKYNPENSDAAAGLEKIDQIYNKGGL